MRPPRFQAHRGFHDESVQENTLEAFRQARARGARACECDVQLTKDDVPVVYHDEYLTRLFGRPERVRDLNLSELKKIGDIPTLADLLSVAGAPEFLNIELKTRRINGPLSPQVAAAVKKAKARDRVMFSSFNPFALKLMENLLPDVPRALLVTGLMIPENPWYLRTMALAPLLKIQMLNLEEKMLTAAVWSYWSGRGMPLSAWTVNDADRARAFLNWGVESVISDLDPRAVL